VTDPIEGEYLVTDDQPTAEATEDQVDAVDDADTEDDEERDGRTIERLEHEGDIAADYLEELLDIADIDGDIDLDVEGDRALVAVVGQGLDQLVGPDGEVLEALQELTRLAVYRETGERSRLMLDIAGHRARRRSDLIALAEKVVDEVRASGQPVKLGTRWFHVKRRHRLRRRQPPPCSRSGCRRLCVMPTCWPVPGSSAA
jgi:spoIIIJ-associated protein